MRVFLTGATGAVGSHVARRLVNRGHRVAALIRPGSQTWRIDDVIDQLDIVPGGLSDVAGVAGAIKSFAPEATVHLAWGGVANTFRDAPQQRANLQATLDLLGAGIAAGCRAFIGLGSQAEYGVHSTQISEDTPADPVTMYGAAKLATYLLARRVCATANVRFAWLRLFSSYGPADAAGWFIPYMILQLLAGKRPATTAGEQCWDYLYVEDVSEAICLAAEREAVAGAFNLGSGQAVRVADVARKIRDLVDPSLVLGLGEVPYRPDQVMFMQADTRRLRQEAGWSPRITLDEGLARTVQWFRRNRSRYE